MVAGIKRAGLLPWVPGNVVAVVLATGVFGLFLTVAASGQSHDLAKETELLRARSVEFKREDAAYRSGLSDPKISATDRADYAEFVAGLRRKLFEQCEVVRQVGGEGAIADFDCVRTAPQAAAVSLAPVQSIQTDDEKRAAIRARLSQLEGAIDEDLLKRQQEIRQSSAQPSGGSAAGGAVAQASSASQGSAGANQSAAAQSQTSASNTGRGLPAPQSAPPAAGQHERQAAADGGVGDDIVARQLREAAEKESDPALREKLWAEYRKYREAKK